MLTRGSHRSGRAGLPHPAPRISGSRRDRRRYPLSVRRHGTPYQCTGRVSLQRVVDPASPFLHRVSPDGIPLLHRYYGMLRDPAAHLAALRCLRLAIPRLRCCISCPASGRSLRPASHGRWAWGLLCRLPHSGSKRGDDRASQVPGEPHCEHALLFDPGGIGRTRPVQPNRCCLPQSQRRRLPRR